MTDLKEFTLRARIRLRDPVFLKRPSVSRCCDRYPQASTKNLKTSTSDALMRDNKHRLLSLNHWHAILVKLNLIFDYLNFKTNILRYCTAHVWELMLREQMYVTSKSKAFWRALLGNKFNVYTLNDTIFLSNNKLPLVTRTFFYLTKSLLTVGISIQKVLPVFHADTDRFERVNDRHHAQTLLC